MRPQSLLLLALAALCLGHLGEARSGRLSLFGLFGSDKQQPDEQQQMKAPAFQKETEYQFNYNAQIASGLIAQDEQSQSDAQQKAITRIQCQARITFASERHAQLCLERCRAGQLNEQVKDEQRCQPMSIFESKKIPSEKQRQLDLCCQFDYAEGVIERVQFDQNDDTWSQNIKRGVLQMIQLNLKQNNAQGLRQEEDQQNSEQNDQENEQRNGQQQLAKDLLAESFTIPETNVEGQCQTTYAINTVNPSQQCTGPDSQMPCSFNVTKSINFKQCSKIADVAFGYQTQQQQAQCAQCQIDWYKQQQKQQQQAQQGQQDNNGYSAEQQANGQHPCAKCDPKEVKEQKVDRTTVLRYVLKCGEQQKKSGGNSQKQQQQQQPGPNECQLERAELLAQYVYKNSKTENGQYGAAMHTVVAAELQLRSVQPQQQQVPTQSSGNDQSLMFSNEWETDQKRFYMFGDDEYTEQKSSPFHQVPKVDQAKQALRKLVQATQNDQEGIEPQQAIQMQRLVQMLRMATQRELKQIQEDAEKQHQQDDQKATQIYANALATCGTRNCVKHLSEKILKEEIPSAKCALALNALQNLPAPSDSIVETVQQLCQSQKVQSNSAFKQTCWLTFGALVNELCQHKTQKAAQQSVFGAQSGFADQEQCPSNKKQQYKQAILDEFEKAESTYEKVLALSALGNAGIDTSTKQLEQIINNKREQRVVRVKAIDALRRLRTQQPRQIQQILLPIYQNTREQPEVRTAAFAILMYTLPEQSVVDQVAYTIGQEPNKQVQAFAYRTMKAMANSQNPAHSQIRRHIKSALKLANVDEQQLRASGKWQIPVFSQQQQEGYFITLASTISQRSSLPAYAHAQIDSVLNDQFHINDMKLYMMQQEAEQWYGQAMSSYMSNSYGQNTRAQRRSSDSYDDNNRQSLRDIYSTLGIKSRRSGRSSNSNIDQDQDQQQQQEQLQQYQQNQEPFAMAALRTADVDQMFIALDEQAKAPMPTIVRQTLESLKNGDKPNLARVLEQLQQQHQIRVTIATNLMEKEAVIPMACGLPLRMTASAPVLVSIQGALKIEPENGGVKVKINARSMASGMHIQKMELWTPFLVSGVESIRSVEANIPLIGEILVPTNMQQGLTMKYKLPEPGTNIQLFGAHSLPVCYAAEVNEKSGLVREPRHVRAIQNPKLERQQHDTNTVLGAQNLAIPMHIRAHYHWPAQRTSYQEFFQMLMATENVVHIRYQPNQDSPRDIVFRLSGEHFQPSQEIKKQFQQLDNFYANQFEPANSEEDNEEYNQEYQQDSHSSRRTKLQTFLGSYQPQKQYKHGLKVSAQTIGGAKEFKAQAEVAAHCDAKLQACHVQMDASRSAMNNEPQRWTLKAQAQLVMPETVSTVQEMEQLQGRNNKFTCQAQAQWGAEAQKQSINIRIKGEQVQRSAWRQLQLGPAQQGQQQKGQGQQQQQNRLKRRTAFLNKYDLEAQYNGLKPATQNAFNRLLELVKSAYFWNSNSQLISQQQQQNSGNWANGKVLASMVIDPITQKHANISVKTPSQLVRLQQIELPFQARPFPLVGQNAQSIQSIGQFIARQGLNSRAECTVDGSQVDTFDDQKYKAPLSTNCYSVLAKDCSSEQPDFVVLMKSIQNGDKKAQKKLKVISPDATIECQPKSGDDSSCICCSNGNQQCKSCSCSSSQCSSASGSNNKQCFRQQQIQCKVNGRTVQPNEEEEDNTQQQVDFNNAQKSDVTVHVPGVISVRFNGRKAWMKVSANYKNGQCGLCGHYNDQGDDEWRMGNNQIASEMSQFHRSYALKVQGQDEECTEQNLEQFYQQNGKRIRNYQDRSSSSSDDEDDQDNNDDSNDEDDYQQRQKFDGTYFEDSNEEMDNNYNRADSFFGGNNEQQRNKDNNNDDQLDMFGNNNKNRRNQKTQSPVHKTKVIERHHEVCFSTRPVKQCPRGTVPSDRTTSDFGSNSSEENNNNDQEQTQENSVSFVCMNRSSSEARQLLRQSRQGQRVLNVEGKGHSYMEKVREPKMCRRA